MTAPRVPGSARIESAIPITPSGLSPRGRLIAALFAAALLLAATAGAAAAGALPTFGARATGAFGGDVATFSTERRGAEPIASAGESVPLVEAHWNGPAVHLDWRGVPYARAETSFFGDRVAVPGDRTVRTLDIVNAGPATGVMTVTMDFEERIPAGARNPLLGEDITIFWEIAGLTGQQSFAALAANDRVEVAELALAPDETAQVTVGFEMPHEVEGSRARGVESALLRFDVGVEMRGGPGAGGPGVGGPGVGEPGVGEPGVGGPGVGGPGDGGPGDSGPGDSGPGDSGPGDSGPGIGGPGVDGPGIGGSEVGGPGTGGPQSPDLAVSGGQLALAALAAAIALALLGLLLLALRRRDRRCDDCDRSIPSDESWVTIRARHRQPETLCRECLRVEIPT